MIKKIGLVLMFAPVGLVLASDRPGTASSVVTTMPADIVEIRKFENRVSKIIAHMGSDLSEAEVAQLIQELEKKAQEEKGASAAVRPYHNLLEKARSEKKIREDAGYFGLSAIKAKRKKESQEMRRSLPNTTLKATQVTLSTLGQREREKLLDLLRGSPKQALNSTPQKTRFFTRRRAAVILATCGALALAVLAGAYAHSHKSGIKAKKSQI